MVVTSPRCLVLCGRAVVPAIVTVDLSLVLLRKLRHLGIAIKASVN